MSMASIQLAPITVTPTYNWRESTCTSTKPQVDRAHLLLHLQLHVLEGMLTN